MHKFLLALVLGSSLTYASTINGIAITVNDEPITQYDIEKTMSVNKISKNEAVSYLIDKVLYDQLVKKNNITADIFETNEYIEKLANSNGMDVYAFKSIVKQEYPNYEVFENEAAWGQMRSRPRSALPSSSAGCGGRSSPRPGRRWCRSRLSRRCTGFE